MTGKFAHLAEPPDFSELSMAESVRKGGDCLESLTVPFPSNRVCDLLRKIS